MNAVFTRSARVDDFETIAKLIVHANKVDEVSGRGWFRGPFVTAEQIDWNGRCNRRNGRAH
jgi:hypothetical protein